MAAPTPSISTICASGGSNRARRFPFLADTGIVRRNCWAGLYENTPDHMPILGRHPDLPNYVDASGFSGHGVMHSPATGKVLSDLILHGHTGLINARALDLARFAEGRLIHETAVL